MEDEEEDEGEGRRVIGGSNTVKVAAEQTGDEGDSHIVALVALLVVVVGLGAPSVMQQMQPTHARPVVIASAVRRRHRRFTQRSMHVARCSQTLA